MDIFWRLILGHFLADFTFQTNHMNAWKRSSVWGMVAHSFVHPVVYAALTWPFLNEFWVNTRFLQLQGWTCVLLLFIIHFLEDEWRVFTIHRFGTSDGTVYFAWDQVVHYASIFILFPLGIGDREFTSLMPEKWPILGILFVLTTHFTTVTVYFIEKDLWGHQFPGDTEKYLGMAERLVVSLSFLLPGQWWLPVFGGWIAYRLYIRVKRIQDFTWLSFAIGGAMAVLCGAAGRWVYTC